LANDAQKDAYVGAYKISKAVVNAHATLLQKDLNSNGFVNIRVAAIDPGWYGLLFDFKIFFYARSE